MTTTTPAHVSSIYHSFISLPEDILLAIICTITPLDTLSLSKTCTLLWRLCHQHVVWVRLYETHVLKEGLADTLRRSDTPAGLNQNYDDDRASTRDLIRETVASYKLAQRWRKLNREAADSRDNSQRDVTSRFTSLPPGPRDHPTFRPLQSTHIVPTLTTDLTSNPTFIKFVDIGDLKYSGRLVLTVSRVIWLVVQVWDIGAGARREGVRRKGKGKGKGKGKENTRDIDDASLEGLEDDGDEEVAKDCLCQWSARGASFTGLTVNEQGDKDGTVAIGLLRDGRHCIQILKLIPPSPTGSASWSLEPVFTLSDIAMDMYPVSLIGAYLCAANAGDRTEIINWKTNQRAVLRSRVRRGGDGLQYNKCSQVLIVPETKSVLVIRARSIHLFKWPKFYPIIDSSATNLHGSWSSAQNDASALSVHSGIASMTNVFPPASTSSNPSVSLTNIPQPEIETSVASHSFGWVDCITATIASGQPRAQHSQTDISQKKTDKPIYIFFRGTLDDPWADDDTKLEVWVIEPNPDWYGLNDDEIDNESSPAYERFSTAMETDQSHNINVSSSPLDFRSSNIMATASLEASSPYLFPPTPLRSLTIPTPRGPLLCPTLILSPNMTAVWIEPKERVGRVGGMVVDYDGLGGMRQNRRFRVGTNIQAMDNVAINMGGGTRVFGVGDDIGGSQNQPFYRNISGNVTDRWKEQEKQRRRKREKVMVVAFPGPFSGSEASNESQSTPSLSPNVGTSMSNGRPQPLQLTYNSSPSNWSAIDYDEDRGRVVVASSISGFVVIDL